MSLPIIHPEHTTFREGDPNMSPRDLTLIVAATSEMGIGKAGGLPWKGLKKEMAYFARVTKRANAAVRPLNLHSKMKLTFRSQLIQS